MINYCIINTVMERWERFKFYPNKPFGNNNRLVTGSKKHLKISKDVASEGIVLLKNNNNILPLNKNASVALFGKASADYVKGGGGSGDTTVAFTKNLIEALEEKNINVFKPLNNFYLDYVNKQYAEGKKPGQIDEIEIPNDIFEQSKNFDVAIISLCRYSFEEGDLNETSNEGGYYLTNKEKVLIEKVTNSFKKVIVVLNTGSIIDASWFNNNNLISSVLSCWQGGMLGTCAIADALFGDVNPSGRLADTMVSSLNDYPSFESFYESKDYVNYIEDIYVGYRYFETIPNVKNKVIFPFGYGLSYTEFKWKCLECEISKSKISIKVEVSNIGKLPGKDVIQIYSSSDISKYEVPSVELRAFKKTKLLNPGEKQIINLIFNIYDLSIYDEKTANYLIPGGTYNILLAKNIRDYQVIKSISLEEKVVKHVKNRCIPMRLPKRLKKDGTFELLEVKDYPNKIDVSKYHQVDSWHAEYILPQFMELKEDNNRITFNDVISNKVTLEQFIDSLSIDELITLVGGTYNRGIADTRGIGGLDYLGIPAIMTADGPAGLRVLKDRGVTTTAWPTATCIACSWNVDLAYSVGKYGAHEVEENNIGMWLTPAINIHRLPLCGRNFEYFSEDPYLTGKMAASLIKGIQTSNVSACVKHFCCNNKETNRWFSDSIVSERALREIYLKAFNIVIKESKVKSLMTSYNLVNGQYPSENSELLEGILRNEMKYHGLIITDWGNHAEQYREVLAGNNVRMPFGSPIRLKEQFNDGLITINDLKKNVKYLLEFILKLN